MSALSWTLSLRLLWFNREQHSWNYNWKFSSIIVMLYNYHFCTWSTPDQWHDGLYAFICFKGLYSASNTGECFFFIGSLTSACIESILRYVSVIWCSETWNITTYNTIVYTCLCTCVLQARACGIGCRDGVWAWTAAWSNSFHKSRPDTDRLSR